MFILQATNIRKQYGERTVLNFEGIQVYEGDKIGVVGPNGAGKTTLLRILSGEEPPDSGTVTRRCEAAFIRQLPAREGTLSGGETMKRQILRETYHNGQIIFADEPTANLDADGIIWVKSKLKSARTVLVVSHDRNLLDEICTRIVEVRNGKLCFYTGNYSEYERMVAEEKARHQADYKAYQRKKAQLEAAIAGKEQHVARQRQKKRREYANNLSEARLGGHKRKASTKKQEQESKALKARLERLEKVEREKELPKIHIDFSLTDPPENKLVITCEGLHFAYGDKVIFDGASFTVKNGEKLAVTGANGAGKSTLLRLLHEGCDAIRPAPKLRYGFLYQSFENLDPEKTVLDNVLATAVQDAAAARSILAGLLFRRDEVFKKVGVLSGGEKIRLSIAKLVASECNALLLDEPTNYLDIRSLKAVERMLREYPGTILFVSHDRGFVDALATGELRVAEGKVTPVSAKPSAPDSVRRTMLEMQRVRLLTEISSAPPERKSELEAEFARVVEQLRSHPLS